jgi:hypothetical protein
MSSLTATDIHALVVDRATRHGSRNSQAYAHLRHRIGTAEPDAIFWGLLQAFRQAADGGTFVIQELSGQLLRDLNPPCLLDCETLLRQVIPQYDASVEELPWYLATQFGDVPFRAVLDRLKHDERLIPFDSAIDAMQFWLTRARQPVAGGSPST